MGRLASDFTEGSQSVSTRLKPMLPVPMTALKTSSGLKTPIKLRPASRTAIKSGTQQVPLKALHRPETGSMKVSEPIVLGSGSGTL